MPRFAAFLRGINVGGNKPVKMTELVAALERAGLERPRTVIASGNVLFDSAKSAKALEPAIERALKAAFGFEVRTLVRSIAELEKMISAKPFGSRKEDKKTKLYVTFFSAPVKIAPKPLSDAAKKEFNVLKAAPRELYWLAFRLPNGRSGTLSGMPAIEKAAGKVASTTRNWNTIVRIVELAKKA